jgi:hypothetical protein
VRVTLRREGIAQAIPGRSVDLGEGGIGVVLAGSLSTGDNVGVEFILPELGLGLQTIARVRYHDHLRSGFEFMALSLEQQAMIRRWTRKALATTPPAASTPAEGDAPQAAEPPSGDPPPEPKAGSRSGLLLIAAALLVVTTLAMGWWRWHRDWAELDRQARTPATAATRIVVTPGVAEHFIESRVEPSYPEGTGTVPAVVLVRVVVGADGTVVEQSPLNGPEALTTAAMDAVKQWRFHPYQVKGEPVEVEAALAVEFHPRQNSSN